MKENDKEILKLLWTEVESLKKHPEYTPTHRYAKGFAIGWIVVNIISKIESKYSIKELNEFYKKEGLK